MISRRIVFNIIFISSCALWWLFLKRVFKIPTSSQENGIVIVDSQQTTKNVDDCSSRNYAFASLCYNMRTVFPALILFHQIKSSNHKVTNFVVIIPDTLAEKTKSLFEMAGIITWVIPKGEYIHTDYPVQSLSTRRRDRILWHKLLAWKLTDYEKVVMLDSDILLLKNIDELFDLTVEFAGVPAIHEDEKIIFWDPPEPFESDPLDAISWRNFTKPTRFEAYHSGLNAGVMFLRPSETRFKQLSLAASYLSERTCCPAQEFLFRFFELQGQYHRLPITYNMRKSHRMAGNQLAMQDIKVYHFVEKKKPWLLGRMESKNHRYESRWWAKADAADADFSQLLQEDATLRIFQEARHAAINPQYQ